MRLEKRELVSFTGKCAFRCKHCFAYDGMEDNNCGDIAKIIKSLRGKDFDVVYISHYRENFIIPEQGLSLCEEIFQEYKCDIFIITRSVFNIVDIKRLVALKEAMLRAGRYIYVCSSVSALQSYEMMEDSRYIPSPLERIAFLKTLKENGIFSLLTIRPLFPEHVIPLSEVTEIIDLCGNYVDAILSSGLAVTDRICERLGIDSQSLSYDFKTESEYLVGIGEKVRYVDVSKEINELRKHCLDINLPFFLHSMPALNYLRERAEQESLEYMSI